MASFNSSQACFNRESITRKLYTSHFLSTWNMRLFEFGAVLFLANIFPGTLLPMSIYALARALAAVLFSPLIGRYIDISDRLASIRISIVGQRSAVVLSCLLFWAMLQYRTLSLGFVGAIALASLSLLACVERLCAVANTIAVERDWVVVISGEDGECLQSMNAQMRRIDLFCKLIGPVLIALVDGFSPRVAVLMTLGLNVLSMAAEYALIARVYHSVPALQAAALTRGDEIITPATLPSKVRRQCSDARTGLSAYITSPVFLPSFALSLLYLTVLSFSGQMTTYLLTFPAMTAPVVGGVRTVATVFEIFSTWLAPYLVTRIGPTRAGMWFLSWQVGCLSLAVSTFFTAPSGTSPPASASVVYLFVTGIILSRTGLYAFDLVAQLIVQSATPPHQRATFSSMEASLQNLFELLGFSITAIFPLPAQFIYPACISFVAVCTAAASYAKYVRDRRGHLLHLPCGDSAKEHWNNGREALRVSESGRGQYEMVPTEPETASENIVSVA